MDPSSASMSNKLLLLTGGQADKIEGEEFNTKYSQHKMDYIIWNSNTILSIHGRFSFKDT